MLKFEDHLLILRKNIALLMADLFPVPPPVRPFWTTPDTLTGLSFGRHQESLFMRYQCGEAIGDEYPHHNAADCGEFTERELDHAFEDIEIDVPEHEGLVDTLGEDEWYETANLLGDSLIKIGLAIALAEIAIKGELAITPAADCDFNLYGDYEDAMDGHVAVPVVNHALSKADRAALPEIVASCCHDPAVAAFLIGLSKQLATFRNAGGGTIGAFMVGALNDAPEVRDLLLSPAL